MDLFGDGKFPFSVPPSNVVMYLPAAYSSTGQWVLHVTDALQFFTPAGMLLDRPATPVEILNPPVSRSSARRGTAVAFCVGCSSGGRPKSGRARDSRSCGDGTGEKSMEEKIAFVQLEESASLSFKTISRLLSQTKPRATCG